MARFVLPRIPSGTLVWGCEINNNNNNAPLRTRKPHVNFPCFVERGESWSSLRCSLVFATRSHGLNRRCLAHHISSFSSEAKSKLSHLCLLDLADDYRYWENTRGIGQSKVRQFSDSPSRSWMKPRCSPNPPVASAPFSVAPSGIFR